MGNKFNINCNFFIYKELPQAANSGFWRSKVVFWSSFVCVLHPLSVFPFQGCETLNPLLYFLRSDLPSVVAFEALCRCWIRNFIGFFNYLDFLH